MDHDAIYLGMHVLYVPTHAHGALQPRDVERGVVTAKNEEYVFVRFGGDTHSKACVAGQLHTCTVFTSTIAPDTSSTPGVRQAWYCVLCGKPMGTVQP